MRPPSSSPSSIGRFLATPCAAMVAFLWGDAWLAAYRFFARHLGLPLEAVSKSDGTVDESKTVVEKQEQMQAFPKENPRPADALQGDAAVMQAIARAQEKKP